jgi:predicted transcriptional regulator of viral defense system
MKFEDLLKKVSFLPCFTVGFLTAGRVPARVRLQISRWVRDGRLIRLRKGLYCLAEPYRKINPEKFCIANVLKSPSYVSLQSALGFYGIIPEFVPQVTSVTTVRPQTIETPLGRFDFRHISKKMFWGYKKTELSEGQSAFVARPEKALLDLVYLTGPGDSLDFLEELRLQNFEKLDKRILRNFTERTGRPKLLRACRLIENIIDRGEGVEL